MNRRIFSLALSGFLAIIIINWSCTKLDTTTVGSDLIPAVDNINTFADTLAINSSQGIFDGLLNDTTKLLLTELYAVGNTVDPLFGSTDASLYFQLKPPFYPYYIGSPNDTILAPDSVVLCLNYVQAYGDTTSLPITLQAYEVQLTQRGEWDSIFSLRDVNYAPAIDPTPISDPTTVNLATVRSYQTISKGDDSVINQIRIKLNNNTNLIERLFESDSVYSTGGAYSRDTMFRTKLNNGFVVKMVQGNTLLYTQLSDLGTRLELHYKKTNGGVLDTAMRTFEFNTGAGGGPRRSTVSNKIVRTRPAFQAGDQEIFLQTAPGTFATLAIPGLTNYANKIIHRAEIIMEQIPDPASDRFFKEPAYLYYDLVDSGNVNTWKPIYFDLNPGLRYDPDNQGSLPYYPSTGEVNLEYMGAAPTTKTDASGTRLYYTLNVSRYVQQLVTKQSTNYLIRVFAPHDIRYPQYDKTVYPYVNIIAAGRVRLAGGDYNADVTRRMRLRVIYSNVQ